MHQFWEQCVRRAEHLAGDGGPASPLLASYARVLAGQRDVYNSLKDRRLCGALDRDLGLIVDAGSALVEDVAAHGPGPLAAEARALLAASTIGDRLLEYWRAPSDREFFPKALLQPYARRLAETDVKVDGRASRSAGNRCPFCGGAPQLSFLSVVSDATSADGGGRRLLCGICLTAWAFRRVLCAYCGEEDERKLGYFHSPPLAHVRVDACDTCRRYLKTVDLTRLGVAVPLVDEVAAASLDVWARDHGYEKIELNLIGL